VKLGGLQYLRWHATRAPSAKSAETITPHIGYGYPWPLCQGPENVLYSVRHCTLASLWMATAILLLRVVGLEEHDVATLSRMNGNQVEQMCRAKFNHRSPSWQAKARATI